MQEGRRIANRPTSEQSRQTCRSGFSLTLFDRGIHPDARDRRDVQCGVYIPNHRLYIRLNRQLSRVIQRRSPRHSRAPRANQVPRL
jgi:hypothetical protein